MDCESIVYTLGLNISDSFVVHFYSELRHGSGSTFQICPPLCLMLYLSRAVRHPRWLTSVTGQTEVKGHSSRAEGAIWTGRREQNQ